ncbi:hypothetical protein LTR85_012200 [Meristemomyces frigidus]|nr:hypothetical protein LTR85_012200 [Meristemomyces frigidus]
MATKQPQPAPAAAESTLVDNELYAHYKSIVCGVTQGPVEEETVLAALYDPGGNTANDRLLKNLTGVSEPAVQCCFRIGDGVCLPPTTDKLKHGYDLYMMFNKLLVAPTWRVNGNATVDGELTVTGVALSFDANGATCSGFSNAEQHREQMTSMQKIIVSKLRGLLDSQVWSSHAFQLNVKDVRRPLRDELRRVLERLPTGHEPQLPSLGRREYAAFRNDDGGITVDARSPRTPYELMNSIPSLPTVAMGCGDTISSEVEGAVQLKMSAAIADAEARTALQLWARATHQGTLFRVGRFAVLAVNFGRVVHLAKEFDGYLESEALGLPTHDAFFVITSRAVKWFGYGAKDPSLPDDNRQYRAVRFVPHYNSFTFSSQLQTVGQLLRGNLPEKARMRDWHAVLLNQLHDEIEDVDLTEGLGITPDELQAAKEWLYEWRPWNEEQKEVLKTIHKAKGRMSITMGIAGSGKTLIQQALSMYFCKLGFRCGVFAPANSNSNGITKDLVEVSKNLGDGAKLTSIARTEDSETATANNASGGATGAGKIRVTRVFSSSRNVGFREMSDKQAVHRRVGHFDGNVSDIHGLEFKLHSSRNRKTASASDYSLEQIIIDEADRGELHLRRKISTGDGAGRVDVWDVFRRHLAASRKHEFDWNDVSAVNEYRRSYDWCKNHIIALTDVMVTTTGNARAGEIVDSWLSASRDFKDCGVRCRGYIILIDEACKDLEINLWNAITALGDQVVGVFMFGDDEQLKPTNICSHGKLQFNMFNECMDIPLPCRLVREGFPYVQLREQQRMHSVLSRFVSSEFYDDELRDSPRVQIALDMVKPGLIDLALDPILRKAHVPSTAERENGRLPDKGGASAHRFKVVKAHIEVFFARMFPELQAYFGEGTQENLMIVCGHSFALHHYQDVIYDLQRKEKDKTKKSDA